MLYVVPNPDAEMVKRLFSESVYRPLDWRWRLAGWWVHQDIDPQREDHWVQDCYRVQLALQAAAEQDRKKINQRVYDPLILEVHRFAESYMSMRRLEVDARILLGQSTEQIAEACSCAVDLVDAYEAIYFDVRDRLHAGDWIMARAVELRRGQRIGHGGILQVVRFIAYNFGPVVVDVFLAACRRVEPSPDRAPTLDVILGIESPLPAIFKLYLRTNIAELGPVELFRLQRMHSKIFRRSNQQTIDDFLGPDQLKLRAATESLAAFAHAEVGSKPQREQSDRKGLRGRGRLPKPAVVLVPKFVTTTDLSARFDPLLPKLATSSAA